MDLNRQIEGATKANEEMQVKFREEESSIAAGLSAKQTAVSQGFASPLEQEELRERLESLQKNITHLTEKLEEQERLRAAHQTNSLKKNFFVEYDQMGRQVVNQGRTLHSQ